MDWKQKISEEVEDLRRTRDELRVQIHLGVEEAREHWEELERRWQHLEGKLKLLREESRESLDDIGQAARLLAEEIRRGYWNLRERL